MGSIAEDLKIALTKAIDLEKQLTFAKAKVMKISEKNKYLVQNNEEVNEENLKVTRRLKTICDDYENQILNKDSELKKIAKKAKDLEVVVGSSAERKRNAEKVESLECELLDMKAELCATRAEMAKYKREIAHLRTRLKVKDDRYEREIGFKNEPIERIRERFEIHKKNLQEIQMD